MGCRLQSFSRSQALPGNALVEALPPNSMRQKAVRDSEALLPSRSHSRSPECGVRNVGKMVPSYVGWVEERNPTFA